MKNDPSFYYTIFETKAGWIGLLGSNKGLLRSTLPQPSKGQVGLHLGEEVSRSAESMDFFAELTTQFQAFFEGRQTVFSARLDLSQATPFECSVWETTRSIPWGQTRSYAWVAEQIGKPSAPRAVGNALGRNRFPIIVPCHRILGSDGSLHGFGGGLKMKQMLLDLESKNEITHLLAEE
jgi:methylated-DNA-[protein]-cysteine S-methyltransferase